VLREPSSCTNRKTEGSVTRQLIETHLLFVRRREKVDSKEEMLKIVRREA